MNKNVIQLLTRVHGRHEELWKYNKQTQEWEGNPVFEPKYKNYFDSLKNKNNRTETTEQSLPMLPKDLEVIMQYLDSPEGIIGFAETRRLFWKAFSSTAITLWTRQVLPCRFRNSHKNLTKSFRNEEQLTMQYKHVNLDAEYNGQACIDFELVFRKTNKDPNKSRILPTSLSQELT